MKVILDTKIDYSHLSHLFDMLKDLELKPNALSQLIIKYEKEQLIYNIYHNKNSFTVSSQRIDIN